MRGSLFGRLFGRRTVQQKNMLDALDQVKRQFTQVSLGWTGRDTLAEETAKLITQEAYINIPTDVYAEVAPGVFDRAVLNASDIKFPFEEQARKILEKTDFSKYIVVLCKSKSWGFFGWHHHVEVEDFDMIKGEVEFKVAVSNNNDGSVNKYDTIHLTAGQSYTIPSKVRHTFEPKTDLFCIIKLKVR